MLIFITLVLIGVPFYWIVAPGRPTTPSHEYLLQASSGLLPLGGESQ